MRKRYLALPAIAALMGLMAPNGGMKASTQSNQSQQQSKKDAVQLQTQAPRPVEQRLNFTNGGTGKDAGRVLNQRQYRKWMRQCPHMRKSKKFKGKN